MLLTLKKYWLIYGFTNTFQVFNLVALDDTFAFTQVDGTGRHLRREKQKTAAFSLRLI
jgi:hypothetical protein